MLDLYACMGAGRLATGVPFFVAAILRELGSARAPQMRCGYEIVARAIKAAPQGLPTSAPDVRHVVTRAEEG